VPRASEAGFTLVELLVSLALLAVASALLLAGMTTGHNLSRRAEAASLASESVVAAQTALRDRIEAMTADALYGPGVPIVEVLGGPDTLRFTAPVAMAQRPAPPQVYRLIRTRAGELSLFHIDPLSTRGDPYGLGVGGWARDPLIGNVTRLDIAYFGAAPPDNQRRWRSQWQDRPNLPELVRLRVTFGPGDRRVWPELIVRPQTTVTTACQLDRVSGECRIGPP
jgi:general secretion pathway protein J